MHHTNATKGETRQTNKKLRITTIVVVIIIVNVCVLQHKRKQFIRIVCKVIEKKTTTIKRNRRRRKTDWVQMQPGSAIIVLVVPCYVDETQKKRKERIMRLANHTNQRYLHISFCSCGQKNTKIFTAKEHVEKDIGGHTLGRAKLNGSCAIVYGMCRNRNGPVIFCIMVIGCAEQKWCPNIFRIIFLGVLFVGCCLFFGFTGTVWNIRHAFVLIVYLRFVIYAIF